MRAYSAASCGSTCSAYLPAAAALPPLRACALSRAHAAQALRPALPTPSQPAPCREDAQAAMDLYLAYIHWQRDRWRYEDLVQAELAAILSSASTNGGDDAAA